MPKIYKNKYGWVCSCTKHFAVGHTRAVAFQEWQKLSRKKEN